MTMKGTVVFYNRLKGYGFAVPEDQTDDVFIHHSEVPGTGGTKWLASGDQIEFEIGYRNGKPVALDIRRLSAAPADGGAL